MYSISQQWSKSFMRHGMWSNIFAINFLRSHPLKYRVDKISRDSKLRGIEFAMRKVERKPKFRSGETFLSRPRSTVMFSSLSESEGRGKWFREHRPWLLEFITRRNGTWNMRLLDCSAWTDRDNVIRIPIDHPIEDRTGKRIHFLHLVKFVLRI